MAETRPHTRDYSPEARQRLGIAIQRAREAAGHPYRPSFAALTGRSVRSLVKLEQGEPVGPTVYEAAADHLPGWTRDTPKAILEGAEPPTEPEPQDLSDLSAGRRRLVEMTAEELVVRVLELAEVSQKAAADFLEKAMEIRREAHQRT